MDSRTATPPSVDRFRGIGAIVGNADLRPTRPEDRTWGAWSFSAVWMGIAHNVNQWILVAAMLYGGMTVFQAGSVILVSFSVVYLAIIANGYIGTRYGIAFPPLILSIFGEYGAYVPIVLRSLSGVAQLGVFVYVTGEGIAVALGRLIPPLAGLDDLNVIGLTGLEVIGYVISFCIHWFVVAHNVERVRRFELIAGPLIMVLACGLAVWSVVVAGGIEPIVSMPVELEGSEFWTLWLLSVAGLIGSMSSLIVNNPDISRFAKSQKSQILGQGIGIPLMFVLFSAITLLATVGTKFAFGEIVQDPIQIFARFDNDLLAGMGSLVIAASTLGLNAATNAVASGFDFAALAPRRLNYQRAVQLALVIGVASLPWLWYGIGQFTTIFYGFIGVVMGPVLGIMLTDYYVVRRRRIDLHQLYAQTGVYAYPQGTNWRAVAATVIGTFLGGAGAIITPMAVLYEFNWFVGVLSGGIIYFLLMASDRRVPDTDTPGTVGDTTYRVLN